MKKRIWTLEQRLQQAQRIRQQKPWEYSTGPKTIEGKNKSKFNAYKHGARTVEIRKLVKSMTLWEKELKQIDSIMRTDN